MAKFIKIAIFLVLVFAGGYAYASRQWQLVEEKSRVAFSAKTTLHDFNGRARRLSGGFEQNLNLARGFVDVDIAGLTTDESDRDRNMYQMFDVSRYPQIHFVFDDTDITKVVDSHDGEIKFTGVMTIHNISHPVTLISKGHMENGDLICEGQMHVHLKDYGLKPLSILGLIRVNDEIAVQYSIVFINS